MLVATRPHLTQMIEQRNDRIERHSCASTWQRVHPRVPGRIGRHAGTTMTVMQEQYTRRSTCRLPPPCSCSTSRPQVNAFYMLRPTCMHARAAAALSLLLASAARPSALQQGVKALHAHAGSQRHCLPGAHAGTALVEARFTHFLRAAPAADAAGVPRLHPRAESVGRWHARLPQHQARPLRRWPHMHAVQSRSGHLAGQPQVLPAAG